MSVVDRPSRIVASLDCASIVTGGQLLTIAKTVPLSAGGSQSFVMRTQYALVTFGFTVSDVVVAFAIGAAVLPELPAYH